MRYWLMKSEPDVFSIDTLKQKKRSMWDGVRNYQARNYMWKEMQKGDLAFFYHSNAEVTGIVGLSKIVSEQAYPDPTQFDPKSEYYDPKATKENPRWFLVDIEFVEKFPEILTLQEMKTNPLFMDMMVAQKGSRLSINPVEKKHAELILQQMHRSQKN